MDIEGEVIIENVELGVKFVSDIYCHGDVRSDGNGVAEAGCNDSIIKDGMFNHILGEYMYKINDADSLAFRSSYTDKKICESSMESK